MLTLVQAARRRSQKKAGQQSIDHHLYWLLCSCLFALCICQQTALRISHQVYNIICICKVSFIDSLVKTSTLYDLATITTILIFVLCTTCPMQTKVNVVLENLQLDPTFYCPDFWSPNATQILVLNLFIRQYLFLTSCICIFVLYFIIICVFVFVFASVIVLVFAFSVARQRQKKWGRPSNLLMSIVSHFLKKKS